MDLRNPSAPVSVCLCRNLSHEFVDELEELFERYTPHYCRHSKQRDLDSWGQRLEQGGCLPACLPAWLAGWLAGRVCSWWMYTRETEGGTWSCSWG